MAKDVKSVSFNQLLADLGLTRRWYDQLPDEFKHKLIYGAYGAGFDDTANPPTMGFATQGYYQDTLEHLRNATIPDIQQQVKKKTGADLSGPGTAMSVEAAAPSSRGEPKNRALLEDAGLDTQGIEAYKQYYGPDYLTRDDVVNTIIAQQDVRTRASGYSISPDFANMRVLITRGVSASQQLAALDPHERRFMADNLGPTSDTRDSVISVLEAPRAKGWSPEQIKELQARLAKADPADMKGYVPGSYDKITRDAYAAIVQEAVFQGKTPDEIMDAFTKAHAQQKFKYPAFRPSDYHPRSAEAIRVGIGEPTAQQTLGRSRLSQAEETSVEASARKLEGQDRAAKVESDRRAYEFSKANAAYQQGFSASPPAAMPEPVNTPAVTDADYAAAAQNALIRSSPIEAGGEDIRNAILGFLKAI